MKIFGAVCLEGPKWCGKTWTSLANSESVIYIGDPQGNFQNRKLAELNPKAVLVGAPPRLIDEWQEVPQLWDAIRAEVDVRGLKGQFILTGSSTPNKKGILHSGVGRIHTLRMRTLSLFESGDSSGEISLKQLFDNQIDNKLVHQMTLERIIELVVRGGWPSDLEMPSKYYGETSKSYLQILVENDIYKLDGINRDKKKVEALLRSLARNESTLASNAVLIRDINKYEKERIN